MTTACDPCLQNNTCNSRVDMVGDSVALGHTEEDRTQHLRVVVTLLTVPLETEGPKDLMMFLCWWIACRAELASTCESRSRLETFVAALSLFHIALGNLRHEFFLTQWANEAAS